MNFSYECSELIKELDWDITTGGDFTCWAFSKKISGVTVYFDYDFVISKKDSDSMIFEDQKIPEIPLQVGEKKEKMKASKLLKILKSQNSLI